MTKLSQLTRGIVTYFTRSSRDERETLVSDVNWRETYYPYEVGQRLTLVKEPGNVFGILAGEDLRNGDEFVIVAEGTEDFCFGKGYVLQGPDGEAHELYQGVIGDSFTSLPVKYNPGDQFELRSMTGFYALELSYDKPRCALEKIDGDTLVFKTPNGNTKRVKRDFVAEHLRRVVVADSQVVETAPVPMP